MKDDNKKQNSIIPFGSTALTRVISTNEITNKILQEHEQRQLLYKIKTVKIGTQFWTAKNLDVTHYRNGDEIPEVQDADTWKNLQTGAWCYYDNNEEYGIKYGKLYNWYAAKDPRGLAPKGYHLPSDDEWEILIKHLGGQAVAGSKMKSDRGWNEARNGSNECNFAALPGGCRNHDGTFYSNGLYGQWWSSTGNQNNDSEAWYRYLYCRNDIMSRVKCGVESGLTVRCLRNL